MLNPKAKGSRLERKTRDILEERGYRVTRAAGSLGEWDLVALGESGVLLVQVKANRWPGSVETKAMLDFPEFSYARKEVWRWRDRVKAPDIRVLERTER